MVKLPDNFTVCFFLLSLPDIVKLTQSVNFTVCFFWLSLPDIVKLTDNFTVSFSLAFVTRYCQVH